MAIVFNREDNSELLRTIGISYGSLVASVGAYSIVTMVSAKEVLRQLIEGGCINGDEAQEAERTMREAGIAEDKAALYSKCAAAQLPEGFVPSYSCGPCGCGEHYVIIGKDGKRYQTLTNKDGGISLLETVIAAKFIDVENAVYLAKEIASSNLPIDREEILQRYYALPEDERRRRQYAELNKILAIMGVQVSVARH